MRPLSLARVRFWLALVSDSSGFQCLPLAFPHLSQRALNLSSELPVPSESPESSESPVPSRFPLPLPLELPLEPL